MTFTEIELAAFFHKNNELHPVLEQFINYKDHPRRLTQSELTCDYVPSMAPGTLIQRFIAPVDPKTPTGDRVRGREKRDAGIAAAVHIVRPNDIRNHINDLRRDGFDPKTYNKTGYFLRSSIKTDGYSLQLLAYKLRELKSVKYKRYEAELIPDRLITTTAGTSDYLTEVRNVFKSAADVERLLGCSPDETHRVSYLGVDPGQAFVVGAYAHLPPDKTPRTGRRRQRSKKRGSRGRHKRGSGKGTKSVCRMDRERHINLTANQKAVARPTLVHRGWMEKQTSADLKQPSQSSTTSTTATAPKPLSIRSIESSLSPLRGSKANFATHVQERELYTVPLTKYYNGSSFNFKKHKRMSQKARQREFERLADSLLRMVGGSLGERRREEDIVVIAIGMGRFTSASRLSSLHSTFEDYFIHKVTIRLSITGCLQFSNLTAAN